MEYPGYRNLTVRVKVKSDLGRVEEMRQVLKCLEQVDGEDYGLEYLDVTGVQELTRLEAEEALATESDA